MMISIFAPNIVSIFKIFTFNLFTLHKNRKIINVKKEMSKIINIIKCEIGSRLKSHELKNK